MSSLTNGYIINDKGNEIINENNSKGIQEKKYRFKLKN